MTNEIRCVIISFVGMREWRNWQTRTFEGRVVTPYGFKSRFSHHKKTPDQSVWCFFVLETGSAEAVNATGVLTGNVFRFALANGGHRPTRKTWYLCLGQRFFNRPVSNVCRKFSGDETEHLLRCFFVLEMRLRRARERPWRSYGQRFSFCFCKWRSSTDKENLVSLPRAKILQPSRFLCNCYM